jgi:hypothetical protein
MLTLRSLPKMTKLEWLALFVFGSLTCVGVGVGLSRFHIADLKPSDGVLLLAGLLPAAVVWWQGHLIKQQMQLQAIIELGREWNSWDMLENRRMAWNSQNEPDIENIESILEFLEKVSTFEKQGVISAELIWDTFGWYVSRYYHYSKDAITQLRKKWTPKGFDRTLYKDLEDLANRLLKQDIKKRNKCKDKGLD